MRHIGCRWGGGVALAGAVALIAVPALGSSTAGATSPTAPLAPSSVSAVAGYQDATVTWTVGINGGDPITSFVITPYIAGTAQTAITVAAAAVGSALDPTPGSVDTWTDAIGASGTGYSFTVAAVNAVGTSVASAVSNTVNPASGTVPGAPTAVMATALPDSAATVQWTVPPNNGSAITMFFVQGLVNGGISEPASADGEAGAPGSPLDPTPGATDSSTLTGLTGGTTYTFEVLAENGTGIGPMSIPSNAITATVTPGVLTTANPQVVFPAITLGDFSASISVTLSNTGTVPVDITGFDIGGADPNDFIEADPAGNCDPSTLGPGENCTENVAFVPGALGNRTATLIPIDGLTSSPSIYLSGTGTEGYYIATAGGNVTSYGDAQFQGGLAHVPTAPIVDIVTTGDDGGYWMVGSDGQVYNFGDATYFGGMGGVKLNKPIVGMAVTPDDAGYWLVASDGGIFAFVDATYYGSTGGMRLNKPIVGMATTPDGAGYWLVASDGGIFSFGDAPYYGSTGGMRLNKPIVGMAPTPDGGGYWLVASDGGIFTFGDAPFYGSTGAIKLNRPIVGMAASPDGAGYWLVASDGGIFSFGDAPYLGSEGAAGISNVAGMVVDGGPTIQATFDIPAIRTASAHRLDQRKTIFSSSNATVTVEPSR
jgi:hypothetical protein